MKSGKRSMRVAIALNSTATLLFGVLLSLLPSAAYAQQAAVKRILVLYWYNKDYPWNVGFDQSFQAVLRSAPGGTAEYYAEYLESDRFPEEKQSALLHDYLQQKYGDHQIDAVVANSDASLDFLLKHRGDLFRQTPMVFVATAYPLREQLAAKPGLTGIINVSTHRKTLDLALRLHPDTQQVFVISGTIQHDKKLEAAARQELQGYESKVNLTYLTDYDPDTLVATMKKLPKRSLVLYVWQQSQGKGARVLESVEVLSSFAHSTPVPIYGMSTPNVGHGIVGGYVNTAAASGTRAAEIALQIANGARANDIPVETAPSVPIFDWRELQRWGISEDELPTGSIVRFKAQSFWDQGREYVVGAITLIVLQTVLLSWLLFERQGRLRSEEARLQLAAIVESSDDAIIGLSLDGRVLSWNVGAEVMYGYTAAEMLGHSISMIVPSDRTEELYRCLKKLRTGERIADFETGRLKKGGGCIDVSLSVSVIKDARGRCIAAALFGRDVSDRKRAEEALRESEARFRNMADTAPVLVWMSGTDQLCTYFNRLWLEFTGRTIQAQIGNGWAESVHASDYERCIDAYNRAFAARSDFRTEYRLKRHDGEYRWILATGVPRYTPDGTFAGYIGSAIDITERKRDEQELQRLAVRLLNLQDTERRRLARELHDVTAQNLFAINLNLSRLQPGHLKPSETETILSDSRQLCEQALQEIRTLTYVLHPPVLDQVGLVAALRWYVDGFVKRSGVNIETNLVQEIGRLPDEVETALFRIVQESLTNIKRHSGSSSANISLEKQENEIILQIVDHGRGMSRINVSETDGAESLGVGIPGMRQRLHQFGGILHVESNDRGTVVTAKIPAVHRVIDDSQIIGRSVGSA